MASGAFCVRALLGSVRALQAGRPAALGLLQPAAASFQGACATARRDTTAVLAAAQSQLRTLPFASLLQPGVPHGAEAFGLALAGPSFGSAADADAADDGHDDDGLGLGDAVWQMNRNARWPKKANHGARPCSHVRRRFKRDPRMIQNPAKKRAAKLLHVKQRLGKGQVPLAGHKRKRVPVGFAGSAPVEAGESAAPPS